MDDFGTAIGVLLALLATATFVAMIWAARQVDGRPHGGLHLLHRARHHGRKDS
jgi:hypothetical protein